MMVRSNKYKISASLHDTCNSLSLTTDPTYFRQYMKLMKKLVCLNLKCYKEQEFISNDIQGLEEQEYDSPVYSCKFGTTHETNNLLALAYEDGRVVIQSIQDSGSNKVVADTVIHRNAIFEIDWSYQNRCLVSASADSTLCSLSLDSTGNLIPCQTFRGHSMAVKTVNTSKWEPDVFASGGRDCNIILWDMRCHPSNKSNEISGAHSCHKSINSPCVSRSSSSQVQNSIISILFCKQYNIMSAGASDGLLKYWDLRKTYSIGKREPLSVHTFEYAGNSSYKGYTSMCLSPFGERIYVSCLDGKIYCYHIVNPTLQPVAEYFGHKPKTYYTRACLSPCGSVLISGSSDERAYLWMTENPGKPVSYLSGHLDEVTSVAWSHRNLGMVVTCSDDRKHRIFQLKNKNPNDFELQQSLIGSSIPYQDPESEMNSLSVAKISKSSSTLKSPSMSSNSFNSVSTNSHQLGDQHILLTPRQSKVNINHNTPKTSENKTLLSWLSSSKTPKMGTPTDGTPNPEKKTLIKGKATLKRKLTDIMEGEQENVIGEPKKVASHTALSPPKSVLAQSNSIQCTPPGVAKMLLYENLSRKKINNKGNLENMDENESLTTDKDQELNIKETASVFKNKFDLVTQYHITPEKSGNGCCATARSPLNASLLSSPTANLPNFVIDGLSPHNRTEPPVYIKRQSDWLTSLSLSKNKFSENIRNVKGISPKLSTKITKKGKNLCTKKK